MAARGRGGSRSGAGPVRHRGRPNCRPGRIARPLREHARGLLQLLALARLRPPRRPALPACTNIGYQAMRQELGIEPGAWLRGVYQRILAGRLQISCPGLPRRGAPARAVPFR